MNDISLQIAHLRVHLDVNVDAGERYDAATRKTDAWVHAVNGDLAKADLPMRVDNLTTVWTVLFTQPGRYHWMFQYYLRAKGLALSWVGTGRCLFSLDFTLAQYDAVKTALLNAAKQMRNDGWWDGDVDAKSISKKIAMEVSYNMIAKPLGLASK